MQQTFKFSVCPLDKFKTRLLKPCHEHQISDLECLLLTLIVLWCITKKNSGTSYTVIHFVGTFNILRMSIYTITRKIRSSILCCIYDDDEPGRRNMQMARTNSRGSGGVVKCWCAVCLGEEGKWRACSQSASQWKHLGSLRQRWECTNSRRSGGKGRTSRN